MHTVVIGGGIIGLTTAYQLAREGETVTLVDARATGLGAAEVNAGWVVPADSLPLPGPGAVVSALKWMTKRDSPGCCEVNASVARTVNPAFTEPRPVRTAPGASSVTAECS